MQSSQFVSYGLDGPGPSGFAVASVAAVVLVAAWVILAASRFVHGGVTHGGAMERPDRVPQLYGYTLCLVGLLWAAGSVVGLVESATALAAPAYQRQNEFGFEPSVTSFEAFRLTYDRARRFSAPDPGAAKLDTVPEAELRRRFAVYRADRIAATTAEARQALVTRSVSLLLGVGLFAFHWRWLRRRGAAGLAA